MFAEHREDFVQHANGSLGRAQGTDFLPRRVFGEFVEAQVRAQIDAARARGQRFAIQADQAVGVHAAPPGGYQVELADTTRLTVDAVVLATGALSPRPLKSVSNEALTSGRYELDPWRMASRAEAPRRVLVIGTGLTAVDTLISASTRWPSAELVAVSRHGLMPFRHPPLPLPPYPSQPSLNASLLACQHVASMLRLIRQAFTELPSVDWRAVVDGMRPVNAQLWQRFTLAQRRQFMRHLRWVWEASRHRTAPASADRVEVLRECGRLQVHAARVLSVDAGEVLTVTVRSRATQLLSTFEADLVIQATGLDTAVAYAQDPLLAQLLRDELATPDPLHLGLSGLPNGQLLDQKGSAQPGLYAIGSLLRGSLWECTAMPEIRTAAHRLAELLVRQLGHVDTEEVASSI
ncbi:MAG: FAD/NAD(P)-binding protein [Pseudomonadota bacterium]|nr:FAD/NAD(P)-binding protein [Pseudomonadota bacterium]